MTMRRVWYGQYALMLACASLFAGCAQDKEYEGVTVSANNLDRAPYIYNAFGSLDFEGQDSAPKATKAMYAACPQGQPVLMFAQASRFQTETGNHNILAAMFTCNQRIPGVE